MLKPTDITDDVLEVLRTTATGKGYEPQFVTAYQILNRLPDDIKDRLVRERGDSGKGAGSHYSPATLVAQAGKMLHDQGLADWAHLDGRGLLASVESDDVEPGYPVCSIFRWVEGTGP